MNGLKQIVLKYNLIYKFETNSQILLAANGLKGIEKNNTVV